MSEIRPKKKEMTISQKMQYDHSVAIRFAQLEICKASVTSRFLILFDCGLCI